MMTLISSGVSKGSPPQKTCRLYLDIARGASLTPHDYNDNLKCNDDCDDR